MALIQISGKRSTETPLRTEAAITSDKLFSLGMVAALIGSILVGAYLWLGLNNQIPLSAHHLSLRLLHAKLQIHFFLGAFILGFLLQGAPRILESRRPQLSGARYIFPMLLIALVVRLCGLEILSDVLTAVTYFGALVCLSPVFLSSSAEKLFAIAAPSALGLLVLSIGVFFEVSSPTSGLALFWCGIMPVIFGVGQQFIYGILGASLLKGRKLLAVAIVWFIGAVALLVEQSTVSWLIFAASAFSTFALYIAFTQMLCGLRKKESFVRGFIFAWIWGLLGGLLALSGPHTSDSVLHLWGAGLAMTLIFVVSSRVVSHVTYEEVLPNKLFYPLIGLWQLVPLGRGFRHYLGIPNEGAWIVALISCAVLLVWIGRIMRSLVIMIMRLRTARSGKNILA